MKKPEVIDLSGDEDFEQGQPHSIDEVNFFYSQKNLRKKIK